MPNHFYNCFAIEMLRNAAYEHKCNAHIATHDFCCFPTEFNSMKGCFADIDIEVVNFTCTMTLPELKLLFLHVP